RTFLVEIILAICAALNSGRVRRRIFAAPRFSTEDPNRDCVAFLGCATRVSAERSAADVASSTARCNKRGRRTGVSCRTDRNGRWNISDAVTAFLPVGPHSASRRRLGAVHLGELDRRAGWLF